MAVPENGVSLLKGRLPDSDVETLSDGQVINLDGGVRLQVIGSTLRSLPDAVKADIVNAFLVIFEEALHSGELAPVVDRVLPLADAQEAHRIMQASLHFGKIVLEVG